jgi:putative methionine-R-sulfoxide reductase with GAF domain
VKQKNQNSVNKQTLNSKVSTTFLKKQVYVVVGGIFAILISLVLLGLAGMETVSGMRSFVGAEGLWSKSQKRAVFNIVHYASSHEEKDYTAFKNNLKIQAGHKQARLELEKADPNLVFAYEGLIQGGNHPLDVKTMGRLFMWFRNFEYVDKAISIWARADVLIVTLERQGEALHKLISSDSAAKDAKIYKITHDIIILDGTLTNLEYEFSYTLGEAARWAKGLLFIVMMVSALIAGIICVWLIMFVGKIITKMQLYSDELTIQRSELIKQSEELTNSNRLATGQSKLDAKMRGEHTITEISRRVITFIVEYLDIPVGAIYVKNTDGIFVFKAGYSFVVNEDMKTEFAKGEGLVGQAAVDKQFREIKNVPAEYLQISSSIGSGTPATMLVVPFVYNDTVIAVMELASFVGFTEEQKIFIKTVLNSIAITIHSRQ